MGTTLRKPHEYHVDRGTRQAIMDRVNATSDFKIGEWSREYPPPAGSAPNPSEEPHGPILAQKHEDGVHFFGSNGREIPALDVPAYIHERLLRDPLRLVGETKEQVLKFCPYCPENDNAIISTIWEAHLLDHLARAGIRPVSERPEPEPEPEPEPDARPIPKRRGRPPKVRTQHVSLEG